ncbi:hypothetical protein [Sandaracinus amylolyticus]|uniref:hypothetical protein n=1 Tax=Sandaracinus amylolyticus TaxID=927083 RepID=UPI001F33E350|nr:hypothetical protein [Sandaracinus amylolyticus]UJR79185.1 Hypothetical protein I5071_12180 [Sandaracinus amylolyticus]
MRIGLLGPTEDDQAGFREAVSFLLADVEADQIVYLGRGEFADRAIDAWVRELGGEDAESAFLARAAHLATEGSPAQIEALLETDAAISQLARIRKIPPPPSRAIEMLDDRVVLFVHDKSILDEEDIANAHLIVYGRGAEADLRRFGKRTFFTPGPLSGGRVGVLESSDDGTSVALYDLSGMPVWREPIVSPGSKVIVAT